MSIDDEIAFETWAGARVASLLRFGFALTQDEGAAEDLVESALVRTALARCDLANGDAERYARRMMVAEQQRAWRRPRRRVGVTAECNDPPAAAPAPAAAHEVGTARTRRQPRGPYQNSNPSRRPSACRPPSARRTVSRSRSSPVCVRSLRPDVSTNSRKMTNRP